MVKLNPLSSYEAEDCYRAIRRLATGKKWSKQPQEDESEVIWATNELNCRRKFFRNVETLSAAQQNVGEAFAMAELSLMATSAYAENSSLRRSSRKKRLRHYGHFKFSKDTRNEKESKEDVGYFSRHSRGRTFEQEACRDRVNKARSFQVRRATSHEDFNKGNARGTDGQGRNIRRSSSDRVRPHLLRSLSTGTSPSPVEKRKDHINHQSKDRKSISSAEGRSRRSTDDTVVADPDTGIKYKKGKLLGKGGFAKCFEFYDVKSKEKFAVKIVSKNRMSNPRTREKIIRETEIHRHLEHPSVVTFYGFFECKGSAYLILENCVQRSMVHVLTKRKTLTEPEVRYYMLQLVSGCRYIHGRKIIHRDLKLGNMLLDDQMRIKIADFGLATKVLYEGEKKTSLCGTPNYIAPEVLQKKGHSYEADIWALGCVMYTMLCGHPPFETTSLKETYGRIITSRFTTPVHVTQPAAQLMKKMLNVDPTSRPSLVRISTDKFFLCGYTPSTLSTFCCHTAPRFPLASTTERNRTSCDNIDNKTKQQTVNDVHHTSNRETKPKEKRLSSTSEKQRCQSKNDNNVKTTTAATVANERPKESTITENESNMRSYEKTFRLMDIKRGIVRSASDHINLDKMADVDNCNLSINAQSQQMTDDTKVGEVLEASFETLFQLMMHTVKQHETEGVKAPSLPTTSPVDVSASCPHPLWITKWVDYSNKYGFGYQLSDGRIGILFSDSGHILLSQDRKTVSYTSRLNRSRSFAVVDIPLKLQRKLLVVTNLAEYMAEHLIKGGDLGTKDAIGSGEPAQDATTNAVLVQKWYRDNNVILMQLNNGTLQVNCFKDHSKLILSRSTDNSGDYLLTYVCRGCQAVSWPLASSGQTNIDPEVIERIRLALNLINHAEHSTREETERNDNLSCGATQTSTLLKTKSKPSSCVDIEGIQDVSIKNGKESKT